MSSFSINNINQVYKNEYSTWRNEKNLQDIKRREYLRQNPDAINDYDLQRAKILLYTVDIMDRAVSVNSDHINTLVDTATSTGLGYAAAAGVAFGLLLQQLNFVQKYINKMTCAHPKSKNIIPMAITTLSGVLGVISAYPAYTFLSNLESKIDRKKRFDTMESELQDPRIFSTLDSEQRVEFEKNLASIQKENKSKSPIIIVEKNMKSLKKMFNETINYDKEQTKFREKYEEDKSFYEEELTSKEIKNAKKDKVLLCVLIKELNSKSQSYEEKMQKITDNIITMSFAFGSLLSLAYERIAKHFKIQKSSLPASLGVILMLATTFFATWAQKRASHIGRFKAKQELMENPERLVYISNQKIHNINEDEIQIEKNNKNNTLLFIKTFFKDNKEYENWKKTQSITGKDISKAMETVELSPQQLEDGNRLKTNMFKTFYKVDSNTQNYSSKIDITREAVKYPIMLILGSIGSLLGMKHLINLRHASSTKEIFKETAKYIGTISLFTLPTVFINSHFAKIKKMAARISDMQTMMELEDYRFFADYSRFK